MSIAYGIIVEHGGSITVKSQLGQGTRVTVQLPCQPILTTP
jgi:signal transduction histidine kinase